MTVAYAPAVDVLDRFSAPTAAWFRASFPAPTKAQTAGWEAISSGAHTLIHAPTGSGKTLAAFLWTIDRLFAEPIPADDVRCRVLYVSPLKALAHDIDRNLRAPLVGIRHAAQRLGEGELPTLTTFIRTGDTPPDERRRMRRHPPDILITTPESLYLLLTSQAAEVLTSVRWVIVDEVHAVAGTKRGAHLALSLERLEELRRDALVHEPTMPDGPRGTRTFQRIGLSATQRPLETIAAFLGGGEVHGSDDAPVTDEEETDVWTPRPVVVVDAHAGPNLELELSVPVEDMTAPDAPGADGIAGAGGVGTTTTASDAALASDEVVGGDLVPSRASIWSAIQPRILELIRQNTSTIVFANSRRLAERLSAEINEMAGEDLTRAHHGSVSREQRIEVEEALKSGKLKAVVATSSLELGIDMGAVDLVVQVESPVSVASGLQRAGRAGHQVLEVSRATILPKHRGDLLVSTVVGTLMTQGAVEETRIPRHPLDVLAQQLVATAVSGERTSQQLYELTRRAAPYAELPRSVFDATLDMLAGRYPSDAFAELRPRVVWDRVGDVVTARPGARALVVANAGTIPDRGMYRVALPEGSRVGELDEEMVYESRPGDVFLLGSSSWRIIEITADTVVVTPAPGEPAARMPFWHGDQPGRPVDTGRAVGRFVREIDALDPEEATQRLRAEHHLDAHAATNLVTYLTEQKQATGVLPSDQTVVVERFRDELGDWRVVIHSPLGARVLAPWAMALTHRLRSRHGHDVDVVWADDGIALRFPDADEIPGLADLEVDPDEVEDLLVEHLADTALFAARFREAAGRALLLPRRRPGMRTPLWLQRRRAAGLLATAREFGSFPIVLECYREILQDDFDLPALTGVLRDIEARRIRVVEVETATASPFASSLLFAFVAAFLYEADAPLAERRALALTLDRELLAELLGEGELRELLSAEVIEAIEQDLQRLTDARKARTADDVADLLRHLGPLTLAALEARSADPSAVAGLVDELTAARRVHTVHVGGEPHLVAVEDVSRLRDALGVQPPRGVPEVFLEPVEDPLGDVVARYARTHGPFRAAEVTAALGIPPAVVDTTLRQLEAAGRVVRGAFDPRGPDAQWADADVLRRIKRGSLAALRGEIEPVEPDVLARFLPAWHGIGARPGRGPDALLEVIRRLQGAPIPASVLEREVLATRVEDAAPALDVLLAEGTVVWVGHGSLGTRDGRVGLYLRDQVDRLLRPPADEPPDTPLHRTLLDHLADRGASFFRELHVAAGGDIEPALDALWDLVWAGLVTNDTFAPVRAAVGHARARTTTRAGRPRPGRVAHPPSSAGRWSLVADLLDPGLTPTEQATAWAEQLLERHGVVTRATVAAEGVPGGFTGLYPILARMEETGRVRRGYFVEGLGGAQFALPGAVGRLRSTGDDREVVALAATDPANPYGAALEWPDDAGGRLARAAGAHVLLAGGRALAYLHRGGRTLRRLDPDPALDGPLATALASVARRVRRLTVVTVDDEPVAGTPLAVALGEAGFVPTPQGMRWRADARG